MSNFIFLPNSHDKSLEIISKNLHFSIHDIYIMDKNLDVGIIAEFKYKNGLINGVKVILESYERKISNMFESIIEIDTEKDDNKELFNNIPDIFWAITDNDDILNLKVTNKYKKVNVFIVETIIITDKESKIVDNINSYFHEVYFKKMYFHLDSILPKKNLFVSLDDAKAAVLTRINEKISLNETKLELLKLKRNKLI